ncbi:MAG TPA: filamentous hemagglutinin N-terminal domain-containing protein [Saliniramus sp.]|nr:filamentous hemagglutinin N-terminal domain-containing protein [Saliniramus sp.]
MSRLALSIVLVIAGAGAAHAQIAPDGGTATNVVVDGGGRFLVDIAPTGASGISRNTYESFSVPAAGVDLDNRVIGARTILNEVTSANRSFINGPVEVLGQRAHFILANPNGISIDGGRFINTGGVVLSAGAARLEAMGGMTNVVVGTGSADIDISGAGLAGAMSTLQLAAGRLRIDGPVVNENNSPFADIAITAGNAELTLDSNVVPGSTISPYAQLTSLAASSEEILVDVTPRGSLTASRVGMTVSAAGAGVSFSGNGLASIGDFSIDAQGRVGVSGGQIRAEQGVKIRARSIAILNEPEQMGRIQTLSGGVTLLADAGNIDITGSVTGVRRSGADPDSQGGATLIASGDITLLSENAGRLAIVFASEGDLVLRAGGDLENRNGRLLSNARVDLTVGGTLRNTTDFVVGANGGEAVTTIVRGRRTWLSFLFGRKRTVVETRDYGAPRIPGEQAFIAGASVAIDAGAIVNTGEIDSLDGPMFIRAGSFVNRATPIGSMQFRKECHIVCVSRGLAQIRMFGGNINSAIGLSITAAQSLINDAGQILALGNIELSSPSLVTRAAFLPGISSPPGGLRNLFAGRRAIYALDPFGGTIYAPSGSLIIDSDNPALLFGGEFSGEIGVVARSGIRLVVPNVPQGGVAAQRIGLFQGFLR